jgi:hypothetical protein
MFRAMAVLALSFAGLSCAQDQKTSDKVPESAQIKRLASVTWDLSRQRLVWVVEKGTLDGDEFQVARSERYEISPGEAVMEFENEKRGFSEGEAVSLGRLLDILSLYCAESVDWWEQGLGTKTGPKTEEPKGEKVQRKPKRHEPGPDEMVAGLRRAIARTLQ